MDTIRFILVLSLALVVMLLWDAWHKDYGNYPPTQAISAKPETAPVESADIPQLTEDTTTGTTATEKPTPPAVTAQTVTVTTDLFNIKIDTNGGNIIDAELLKFPLSADEPDKPVHLLTENHDLVYIIQGGIISNDSAPTHATAYSSTQKSYTLAPGQESLQVPLYWQDNNGLKIIKTYLQPQIV